MYGLALSNVVASARVSGCKSDDVLNLFEKLPKQNDAIDDMFRNFRRQ